MLMIIEVLNRNQATEAIPLLTRLHNVLTDDPLCPYLLNLKTRLMCPNNPGFLWTDKKSGASEKLIIEVDGKTLSFDYVPGEEPYPGYNEFLQDVYKLGAANIENITKHRDFLNDYKSSLRLMPSLYERMKHLSDFRHATSRRFLEYFAGIPFKFPF